MRRAGKVALYVWVASEVIDWIVLPLGALAYVALGGQLPPLPF